MAAPDATDESPPTREKNPGEEPIVAMQDSVTQYQEEVTSADKQLREQSKSPDAAAIEATFTSLRGASEKYKEDRDQARGTFMEIHEGEEDFAETRDSLQEALERQDAQIETIEDLIGAFDYDEDDLADGCRQMADETSKLLDANDDLRDKLEGAMAQEVGEEGAAAETDPVLLSDPLTGFLTPIGLENAFGQWCKKDPHRVRSLSVALFDIDDFKPINRQHGREVGDKLIKAIADFLESKNRGAVHAARLAGQRFLFLFGDTDTRFASNVIEQTRQALELARFDHDGEEIRLTVSCAVVEVTAEDTSSRFIARAEATLKEAKQGGRNRTFVSEADGPALVDPPNFQIEEEVISL